jgi:hypothetical protein
VCQLIYNSIKQYVTLNWRLLYGSFSNALISFDCMFPVVLSNLTWLLVTRHKFVINCQCQPLELAKRVGWLTRDTRNPFKVHPNVTHLVKRSAPPNLTRHDNFHGSPDMTRLTRLA